MKEVFLNKSLNFISKNNNSYTEDEIEKIKYGLEGLYLTITKLIIILILAWILNIFNEILLVLLFLNIIRYPAFGIHANKSIECLITSIILILVLPLIIIKFKINLITKIIISIICFVSYLLFAPADTLKRPLTNKKKRHWRKIASCVIAVIYIIIIFTSNKPILVNSIFSALIIEAIMINPLMYKIMGMPYNNYKKIV